MKRNEKQLLAVYRRLSTRRQASLSDFARFLDQYADGQSNDAILQPMPIPRPEDENVPAAIKRLTLTYPMLETARLLDDAASLMSQHLLSGLDAKEIIDKLETVFKEHYEQLVAARRDETQSG